MNKVWLIFLAVFLLLLSSCASEPVSNEQEHPTQTEPIDQIESPSPSLSPWSEEEITVLSKMVWGEARGIPSDTEKAACVVCAEPGGLWVWEHRHGSNRSLSIRWI